MRVQNQTVSAVLAQTILHLERREKRGKANEAQMDELTGCGKRKPTIYVILLTSKQARVEVRN